MTSTSIKSILAVSLAFILSAMTLTASALLKSNTTSACYKITGCTLFGNGLLVGLGSNQQTPTAYQATLALISGDVYCKNKANNALSQGQPFEGVAIQSSQAVDFGTVQKNGRFLAELQFEDEDLLRAINTVMNPDISCQNANWIPFVVVKEVKTWGQEFIDPNPAPGQTSCDLAPTTNPPVIDTSCDVTDNLVTYCKLPQPYFNNTKLALGAPSFINYVCNDICHDSNPDNCNLDTPTP